VLAVGRVKPDAFAGYGGGAAGVFPGLAHLDDGGAAAPSPRIPSPRSAPADGNPCREDLEEAVRRLGRDTYVADLVSVRGAVVGAVAGDLVYAHRDGVRRARPWCRHRPRGGQDAARHEVSRALQIGVSERARAVSRA
jgi:nickel-dependent lactate racemase